MEDLKIDWEDFRDEYSDNMSFKSNANVYLQKNKTDPKIGPVLYKIYDQGGLNIFINLCFFSNVFHILTNLFISFLLF